MPLLIVVELLTFEAAVVLLTLLDGVRSWNLVRRSLCFISARPRLAVAATFGITLVLCAVLGHLRHLPVPGVRDEFAYLLMADTFCHGRLSNPPHVMWAHFNSDYILGSPSYQAKYPPGQGCVLAAGQALFGHPIVGVWFSYAAACAAICWMLQGWVPRKWALVGSVACILNWRMTLGWTHSYAVISIPLSGWGQSYWGGAVAMAGGALLFGAIPRLFHRVRIQDAAVMAVGLVILANSRPYEGLVASFPVLCWLLVRVYKDAICRRDAAAFYGLLVAGSVVLCGACATMYYNVQVTADPLTFPYQLWLLQRHESAASMLFRFGNNVPTTMMDTAARQWEFHLRLLLSLPLAFAAEMARRRLVYLPATSAALVVAAVLCQATRGHPHYVAPVSGAIMLCVVQGCRHLRVLRIRNKKVGRVIYRSIVASYIVMFCVGVCAQWFNEPVPPLWRWADERNRIERELSADGQQHLVFVRYNDVHGGHCEWVYNKADIDNAHVVWAHDLGYEENERLLEYYPRRTAWVVEADAIPITAMRYALD